MGHTLLGARTVRGIAVLTLVGSGAFLAPAMAQASAAQPTTFKVVAAQSLSTPRSASTLVVSPSGIVPASSSAGLLVSSSTSHQQSTYSLARKIVEFVLKKVGVPVFNKLKAAAKKGYAAFKSMWESTVAWAIRKAIEIIYTVYEIYQAIVEIFF